MTDQFHSRFFSFTDAKVNKLIFTLPNTWWSRIYEYAWAVRFAEASDTCLDAGSGTYHPLKFYLSDLCRQVYACDLDKKILSRQELLTEIKTIFGQKAADSFPERYFENINYTRADLKKLPYHDGKFDKIYCISVLEHMGRESIVLTLREFKRTLKDNGLIIITFDYPNITAEDFKLSVEEAGLDFAGPLTPALTAHSMYSDLYGRHYCFRAVLR